MPVDSSKNSNLIWIDQNGGAWTFVRNADNTFTSPAGFFGTLIENNDQYQLKLKHGVSMIFAKNIAIAPQGRLLSIQEPHGEKVTLIYLNGSLASINGALFGQIAIARNSLGLISQITRVRDNLSYYYNYDTNKNLISSSDFAGNTTAYSYVPANNNSKYLLSSIKDPLNREIRFFYNSNGTMASQIEHGGASRSFTYSSRDGIFTTSLKDINGYLTTYQFDSLLRLIETDEANGGKIIQSFNSQNLVVSRTDEIGNTVNYDYDSRGNLISSKKPLDTKLTRITYDQNYDSPISIVPSIDSSYSISLNSQTGDVQSISRSLAGNAITLVTNRNWLGEVTSVNNGLGQYSYQYDTNGLKILDFDKNNPVMMSYDIRARLISSSFKSGRILQYNYDDFDRVISIVDSNGPKTIFSYDLANRVVSKTVTDNINSFQTQYSYDARDRILKKIDPNGGVTLYNYSLDQLGLDKPVSIVDANGKTTNFTYDALDRPLTKTDANKQTTKLFYDLAGHTTAVVSPSGLITNFLYDSNGRICEKIESSVAEVNKRLQTVRVKTDYLYDLQDRVIEVHYLSAQNPKQMNVIKTSFDSLGRVSQRMQYRVNGSQILSQYDTSNYTYLPILERTVMTSASNAVGKLAFRSDVVPPFLDSDFSQQSKQLNYSYNILRDVTGNAATILNQKAVAVVQSSYDPAGRLLKTKTGELSIDISYDQFGRKNQLKGSNGIMAYFSYDQGNRLAEINWKQTRKKLLGFDRSQSLFDEILSYDLMGNVVKEQRESFTQNFFYDGIYQLTEIETILKSRDSKNELLANRKFQYDVEGNRINDSISGKSQYINDFITTSPFGSYAPDSDGYGEIGSFINDKNKKISFYFRPDGKMIGIEESLKTKFGEVKLQSVQYAYDSLGRRVSKTIAKSEDENHECDERKAITQSFVYLDKTDKILQAQTANGAIYTYLDGQEIDEHFGHSSHQDTKLYLTDHLGSVLNSPLAGKLSAFGPFGELGTLDAEKTQGNNPVLYGFAGRQYDLESNLYYNRARMYDSETGRFLSKDPIGFRSGETNQYRYEDSVRKDDTNLYKYGQNNPLINKDPLGLFSVLAGFGGSAAGVTGVEGSAGIYVNPGFFGQAPSAGTFGSAGISAGLNVSGDVFAGAVFGDTSNISGTTINQNISVGFLSVTGFFNPTSGNLSGFTVGFGPSATGIGASTSLGTTGTAQIFGNPQAGSCGAH